MKSTDNKWLVVNKNVILTEHIDPVIFQLDAHFKAANLVAHVTSGLRDAESQLRIIRNALNQRGLSQYYQTAFDDISGMTMYEGEEVYNWQIAWSKLLSVGFIVNPPYPAKVLMDYYRPGSNVNKKGQIIGASPHITGTAFDIGGGIGGIVEEFKVILSAMGHVKGLKGYLTERNNNCLHIDCQPIDLTRNV